MPRRRLPLAFAALALLSVVTCREAPTGAANRSTVRLQPSFTPGALRAVQDLAAFSLVINNVRVVLVRPASDTLVDSTFSVQPTEDEIELTFNLPDVDVGEVLDAGLQFLDGDAVLFSGSTQVTATSSGGGSAEPTEIPTSFVGPGASAVALSIAPRDTTIGRSGSVAFRFAATDANGDTVPDAEVAWATDDDGLAVIDAAGVLQAQGGGDDGTVMVIARTLGGLRDSTVVTIAGEAAGMQFVAQPSDTARNREPFDVQPVVQVVDANGQPVAQEGVAVTASLTAGGGMLTDQEQVTIRADRTTRAARASVAAGITVLTDAEGVATFSGLRIRGTVGDKTLMFSTDEFGSVTAVVTLVAGAPAVMTVAAGDGQSAPAGTAVATNPSVKVHDADANPVGGVPVTFAVSGGGGSITGASATTNANGRATVGSWTLGPTPGPNTLDASATGTNTVQFSATGTSGTTSITVTFCPNDEPIWVAFRNENANWVHVPIVNHQITTDVTDRVAGVAVYSVAAGYFYTEMYFATASELQALASGIACDSEFTPIQVQTSTAGVSSPDVAEVSVGGGLTQIVTDANGVFTLDAFSGENAVVAALHPNADLSAASKAIVRGGLTLANGDVLPALDFNSSEASVLEPHTLTLTNAPTDSGLYVAGGVVSSNVFGNFFTVSPAPPTVTTYTLPSSALGANDLQGFSASYVSQDFTDQRYLTAFYRFGANRTIDFPPALNTPVITTLGTTPYLRHRFALASQPEYAETIFAFLTQADSVSYRDLFVQMTKGYLGGTPSTWTMDVPDLSGVEGFDPAWMLQSGAPVYQSMEALSYLMHDQDDGTVLRIGVWYSNTAALQRPALRSAEPRHHSRASSLRSKKRFAPR